ncbi:GNAT family N-acetyltransferase [Saccharopolyspora sp. 5N708]|uniref:GNAT family N-acetyltransferase n=1 Tax=Saccharopolyspora sp. 5N708 TaxID=3457424 RepID=UPI003FD070C4
MTQHEVRPLTESEFREAYELFRRALLEPPSKDEDWARNSGRYEPGRVLGAFVDGELAGTVMSTTNVLAVPGGRRLSAGAVTAVGVRADHTRRGLLTALMRAQLHDVGQRGEPLAMLHASEAVIYERFGYGVATRARNVELARVRAAFRADAPLGGRVRLVESPKAETGDDLADDLPAVCVVPAGPDRPG